MQKQTTVPGQQRISIEQLKLAKQIECDCGGVLFTEKMMFKKISAILSPSGKEETVPIQVVVCDSCGKVPTHFNPYELVPDKYVAKKKNK